MNLKQINGKYERKVIKAKVLLELEPTLSSHNRSEVTTSLKRSSSGGSPKALKNEGYKFPLNVEAVSGTLSGSKTQPEAIFSP